MKIMTFNTAHCENYMTDKIDFEAFANVIKECNADIVGLNEIRGKGISPGYDAQTEILSNLTGLEHYYFARAIYFGEADPYGNAFLSRYPIASVEKIMIPDPCPKKYDGYYETRCIIKAKLENGLTVIVTHFGLNPDEHENAAKTVLEHLKDEKCIFMGDLNVLPDSEILFSIRERMTDTAEYFTKPLLSFPSDAPDRKIDYIFVSKDIEVVSADIPGYTVSDHRPYTAEIIFDK